MNPGPDQPSLTPFPADPRRSAGIPGGLILNNGIVNLAHLLGKWRPLFNNIQNMSQGSPRRAKGIPLAAQDALQRAKGTPKGGQQGESRGLEEPWEALYTDN